jgi:3-oxoadipate enol-lactonase
LRTFFRYTKNRIAVPSGLPTMNDLTSNPANLIFEFGGARLRYRDSGRGPAVVFLHGWTLDLDMWEFQAAQLCARYRVVRLDRRGFGLSSGVPSLLQDVRDVEALCRHLEIEPLSVVGMSQGARVALALAGSARLAISCMVLDGTPELDLASLASNSSDLPRTHYRNLAQRDGMAAFRREWRLHPLARLQTHDRRAHEILARILERYPGHDLLNPETADEPHERSAVDVARLPPLLLVSGEHDLRGRRNFAKQLAAVVSQAEGVEIPHAGHLCNLDNPQAYNAALSSFLEKHAVERNRR